MAQAGGADAEQARPRVRAAFEKLMAASETKSKYLYTRHVERREFEAGGKLKSEKKLVYRRDPWDEFLVTRLVERDGKPLPTDEATKQEEKLRRSVEELRRTKAKPKNLEEDLEILREVPEALDFKLVGTEPREGRATEVYEFAPRPGYHFRSMKSRLFGKVKGKLWLDQQSGEVAKLDALVFEDITIGFGIFGKIDKGTHFEMERQKLDGGQWFETWQRVRFDVRVMMVKNLRQEIESRFSGFRPR
jgi:hypothetical protein